MIKRLAALVAGATAAIAASWAAIGLRRRSRAARRAERRRARGAKAPARSQGVSPTAQKAAIRHAGGSVEPFAEAPSLQSIKGIGSVAEERLRAIGITSAGEVAAWSDDDVERVAGQIRVSAERIRREDWVGQAKAMSASG
jgi:predicted flap endonuclease-1-like 5' DNA nuclease